MFDIYMIELIKAGKGKSRGGPSVEEHLAKVSHQLEAAGKEHKRLYKYKIQLGRGIKDKHTFKMYMFWSKYHKMLNFQSGLFVWLRGYEWESQGKDTLSVFLL